jgi:putative transcriptional regulator
MISFVTTLTVHREKEMLAAPEAVLKEVGFNVSERCYSRPSCFDFAARKNETLVLIKVQQDIDVLSLNDSQELKAISQCVSAASLLIGEKTREKPLEDDTVYSRYDVLVVTPKTFENIVLRKAHPLIQAGPGGYYVEIDYESIKRRRQELGLSVGGMAESVGISRRTLYGYERGMAKASVAVAYNMIWALGIPVAKPINVFEKSRLQRKCFLSTAKLAIARSKLFRKIFGKLVRCRITTVKKAPFDFVINFPEEETKIIGGVAKHKELELNRRVDEILSFSKVVKAHPILVTEGQKPSNQEIPCIRSEEISKIKNPEDLICSL